VKEGLASVARGAEVVHDTIGLRPGNDMGEVVGRQIGGAQDQPARKAVELDHCQRGGELIASSNEHRAALEVVQSVPEQGALGDVAQ
jgi:hypothetical protein